MTSRGGVWPTSAAAGGRTNAMQTSNSQYGQWFDASRRTPSSSGVRHVNVTSSRQEENPAAPRSDAALSRDQLASRDQPVTTSSPSYDDSLPRETSWRSVALPLSLQRSSTTLGRLATSASVVDSMSSQSHAELIRDYRRYRQLQAGITGDQGVWRGTSRLLTRPTAGVNAAGQTISPTPSTASNGGGITEQTDTMSTTVVPLQLGVAGPLPLQRSVGNVVSARRLPTDVAARRTQTGYAASRPSSSPFVNVDNNTSPLSDTRDVALQLDSASQDCSRPANYNDVRSRQSYVTSPFNSQRSPDVGNDVSRQTATDMAVGRSTCNYSNVSPKRSILKKTIYSGGVDTTSTQLDQLRRSSLSGAVCRQQVLAEERLLPVNAAGRSRAASTKRVTFCV